MREYTDKEMEDWKADGRTESVVRQLQDLELRLRLDSSKDIASNVPHAATMNAGRAEGVAKAIHLMEKRP
jgi:hypothetical protein